MREMSHNQIQNLKHNHRTVHNHGACAWSNIVRRTPPQRRWHNYPATDNTEKTKRRKSSHNWTLFGWSQAKKDKIIDNQFHYYSDSPSAPDDYAKIVCTSSVA